MDCTLVAAIAKNGVIGNKGKLPWVIPEELEWFRNRVSDSYVIMGRETYSSLFDKGLKAKKIGVLSNSGIIDVTESDRLQIFNSVDAVLQQWYDRSFFVIGGEKVYRSFFPVASSLELNFIQKFYSGDTYFPLKQLKNWHIVSFNSQYFKEIKINFTIWRKKD